MSAVTTHVLDVALGHPAVGVPVALHRVGETEALATARTDADGRAGALGPGRLPPGRYVLTFDTQAYFAGTGRTAFYPEVSVTFELTDPARHHHLPLLLSPFGYSTYRGS